MRQQNYFDNTNNQTFPIEYLNDFSFDNIVFNNYGNTSHIYGKDFSSYMSNFFIKLANYNRSALRSYLRNGDDDIICDIFRILILSSINKLNNVPYFTLYNAINENTLNDDISFSSLLNSFSNDNSAFKDEFDYYMGDGCCQNLFMKIDDFNSTLKESFNTDADLLNDIIKDIYSYYIRKVFSSNIAEGNKNFLCSSFNSIIKKYLLEGKVIVKTNY